MNFFTQKTVEVIKTPEEVLLERSSKIVNSFGDMITELEEINEGLISRERTKQEKIDALQGEINRLSSQRADNAVFADKLKALFS